MEEKIKNSVINSNKANSKLDNNHEKNILLKELIVKEPGIRLDAYITNNIDELSRSMVQKLIKSGNVLVNNEIEKESYKVQENDIITVELPRPEESNLKKQNIPLDIIYEDKDILVVNKPKGMVVHPGNGNPDGTLANAIMAHCEGSLSGIGGEIRPGIVHRIDKDTSGLLVIAKNDVAHINLSNQIKNREVKKIYVALVRGVISENEATIKMPIGRSTKDRKKMAVDKNGKEAITHFKVLNRYNKYTYIQVKIDTGRTHQIRVHMSHIGYPVVGDAVYSNGKNDFGVEGQMLHAKELDFKHPTTGENMHFEAPLPEYFEKVLKELETIENSK